MTKGTSLAHVGATSPLSVAYGTGIAAVFIWGATPAATRLAVDAIDPLSAGLLRTLLAALLLIPIVALTRLPFPHRSGWPLLAVSSTMGFVAFTLLFSLGVSQTSAAHAALINGGIPVFTGIFGAISEKRLPRRGWWLGTVMALGGIIVLVATRGGDAARAASLTGDLLCLLSSACAALGYVTGARLAEREGALSVTFWGVLLAGVVHIPLVMWLVPIDNVASAAWTGWGAVGYMAVLSTIAAYMFWYKALAIGGPVRMGSLQFAMPVISVGLAVVLFGDALTLPLVLAAILVLSGVVVMRRA